MVKVFLLFFVLAWVYLERSWCQKRHLVLNSLHFFSISELNSSVSTEDITNADQQNARFCLKMSIVSRNLGHLQQRCLGEKSLNC